MAVRGLILKLGTDDLREEPSAYQYSLVVGGRGYCEGR